MTRHRCQFAVLAALIAISLPLQAQGLRDKFADLFVFGSGGVQLFLPGTADPNNPASVRQHGNDGRYLLHGDHSIEVRLDPPPCLLGIPAAVQQINHWKAG